MGQYVNNKILSACVRVLKCAVGCSVVVWGRMGKVLVLLLSGDWCQSQPVHSTLALSVNECWPRQH